MLTEKERTQFFALLLAFVTATGASGRNCSALFSVSPVTMARWIRAARGRDSVERMFYNKIEPIIYTINRLNAYNAKHHVFDAVARIDDAEQKVAALRHLAAKAA